MTPRSDKAIYAVVAIGLAILLVLTALGTVDSGFLRSTVTLTATTTTTTSTTVGEYAVLFQQIPCLTPSPLYEQDWSVTLGAKTVVVPANGTPANGTVQPESIIETPDYNASSILFLMPEGVYSYQVNPASAFPYQNDTGTVNVDGASVTIYLNPSCSFTGGG